MDLVLDVALIIAIVAFFKEQLGVQGKIVLLYVFLVALAVGFAPLLIASFPVAGPYIEVVLKVVGLMLAAAGSWDAARQLTAKKAK